MHRKSDQQLRREAEKFVKKHGVGSLPGARFENGESATAQVVGRRTGTAETDLPRRHREDVSYSQFATLEAWEDWMLDNDQGYAPLVGSGHATLPQLEKRARMAHVLSYLLPMHIDLLYACHVEGRSQADVAQEFGVSQQNISKRLAVAEQDFKREFGKHWNDTIDLDLEVKA